MDNRNLRCDDEKFFVSHRDYNGKIKLSEKASSAVNLIWSREARDKFNKLCQQVQPDIIHLNLVHRQITLSILDAPYVKVHHTPIVYTAHEYITVCPCYTMLDSKGVICERCLQGNLFSCIKKRCVKDSLLKSFFAVAEAKFIKYKQYYKRISCTIAPSQFLAAKNPAKEGNCNLNRIEILYNPLPVVTRERIELTEPFYSDADPYILYFGRLSKEKGIDILLQAYADYLRSTQKPLSLIIAGTGNERSELERIARELNISDLVKFIGFKSGDELLSIIKGARCTVMPSIWYENMPYSAIESLACGTPIIGSRIGGIPELVIDGRTGITFEPGDADELSEGIARMASLDDYQINEYGNSCIQFVRENHDESQYVDALTALYSELMNTGISYV